MRRLNTNSKDIKILQETLTSTLATAVIPPSSSSGNHSTSITTHSNSNTLVNSSFVADPTTPTTNQRKHNNMKQHQNQQRKRRWNDGSDATTCCPPVVYTSHGVLTINHKVLPYLAVGGALLVLGVHLYLFRQLLSAQEGTTVDRIRPSLLIAPNSTTPVRRLTPLRPIDYDQYTIRINTWQRLDQLLVSLEHHVTCPGVAQIQVVWCEPVEPPPELVAIDPEKIVVERHKVNSLNERFHILTDNTPTLGILSMDDDVLRPCTAIDSGFWQWTRSPNRFVGFDYRVHVPIEVSEGNERSHGEEASTKITWKYGYLSTTQKANRYSMSLPRFAFIHRDYLDWYMTDLPRTIFNHVAENFNCEDIAMSFFVSAHTHGRPPLLANFWAMESMVKLYSPKKISGSKHHKDLRDGCVESFAEQLHLKDRLQQAQILHRKDTMFYCGDKHYPEDLLVLAEDDAESSNSNSLRGEDASQALEDTASIMPKRYVDHVRTIGQWRLLSQKEMSKRMSELKEETLKTATRAGLIEHTEAWEKKYQNMEANSS